MKRHAVLPYLCMLLGSMSFSVMNALVHGLAQEQRCDWAVAAVARTGLALVFAVGLAAAGGARLVLLRPRSLWMRSLAGSISLVCTFFAMTRDVPVSSVLAITSAFPIWVALLQWPLVGERPGRAVWLSVFAAVGGVFLIHDPTRADGTVATAFAVVASLATAVAMLGLHRLQWLDTRAVVAHFSGVSLVFCAVALLSAEVRVPVERLAEPTTLAMLLGVGLSATIGQLFLTKAFTVGSPAKVSVVGLTQVVFSMVLAGEAFDGVRLVGIALVLAPTAWVIVNARRPRLQAPEERTSHEVCASPAVAPLSSQGCQPLETTG
jgi:drug/metabolite transporter (DMT)-like permease